jgi:hypothetical protein
MSNFSFLYTVAIGSKDASLSSYACDGYTVHTEGRGVNIDYRTKISW